MADQPGNPWNPAKQLGTQWQERLFGEGAGPSTGPTRTPAPPDDAALEDDVIAPDLRNYRPWIIQRGRSRSATMLGLRRFDPRGGHWLGFGLPYHGLFAVEYVGDKMVSLDFGMRQFVIEGRGLDELAQRIKQGSIATILEYAPAIWPDSPQGAIVTSIRRVTGE
ncbi:hypothetical protein [Sphingobium cupriresistens]|uniref:Uncharacterized protein n=1 Tax=Sphingobium cupriresistens TaxID=1132417 RepID=A0A8G1ZCN1_9SPHN|nr:hypothetical protein [Sphingobium cupriresistens]RYM05713.1 hypothetical protein EWH12_20940 [Sphingobium cupriresistens]